MRAVLLFVVAALLGSTQATWGHEFWISPERYQVAPGAPVVAALRVGENMEGPSYAYLPSRTERFELVSGAQRVAASARVGDRPALTQALAEPGLWIIVHETKDSRLLYREAELFERFVAHKALDGVLETHRQRGLPATGFAERYRRFAKALVAVGDGAGADQPVGLRTEIVAERNPYTDDLSAGLPVRVLFEGAPRTGAQVEVFARRGGEVQVSTYRTDADGRAVIPVAPETEYLVDAVRMLPLQPRAEGDPVWESLWASLTFRTP